MTRWFLIVANYELGELYYRITGETSDLNKALTKADQGARNTGKSFAKLGGIITSALSIVALTKFSKASIKAASDAEETRNKFNVTFRDVRRQADLVAENITKNYGVSRQESQKLLSNTGDLLTGFKFTGKEALELSEKVNVLAIDLASFTNIEGGAARASAAITKGLLGERESLKELGIAITEADINRLADEKGLIPASLSRQEKALLTYEIAVSQSKNAIGDFARSQNSFANQSRILDASIKDLRVRIGDELLPTATDLIGFTNDIVRGFLELDEGTQEAILAVGGFTAGLIGTYSAIKLVNIGLGNLVKSNAWLFAGAAAFTGLIGLIDLLTVSKGELQKLSDETYKNRQEVDNLLGSVNALDKEQKLSQDTIDELIKIYPDLRGELNTYKTSVDDARKAIENLEKAEASRAIRKQISELQDLNSVLENEKRILEEVEAETGLLKSETEINNAQERVEDAQLAFNEKLKDTNVIARQLGFTLSSSLELTRNEIVKTTDETKKLEEEQKKYTAGADKTIDVLSEYDLKLLELTGSQQEIIDAYEGMEIASARATNGSKEEIDLLITKIKEYYDTLRDRSAFEKFNEISGTLLSSTASLFSALSSLSSAYANKRVNEIDRELQAALESAGLQEETKTEQLQNELAEAIATGDATLIEEAQDNLEREQIQAEFDKKRQLAEYKGQLQAWKYQYFAALAQGAQAPLNAFVSTLAWAKFPGGMALAALNAGLAATAAGANIAAVNASKPEKPTFERGGVVQRPSNTPLTGDNVTAGLNPFELVSNQEQQANLLYAISNGSGLGGGGNNITINIMTKDKKTIARETVELVNNAVYTIDPNRGLR